MDINCLEYQDKKIIIYNTTSIKHNELMDLFAFSKRLKEFDSQKIRIIFSPHLYLDEEFLKKILEIFEEYRDITYFINNDPYESEIQNFYSLRNVCVNRASLIDKNIFYIQKTEKKYDAVYTGRVNAYKRFNLLSDISKQHNLAIVAQRVYSQDFLKDLKIRQVIYEHVEPKKVNEILNQASIGFILSKSEGSCYASAEYLSCGLPVISTFNFGGRNLFYNHENSIICEGSSDSVHIAFSKIMQKIKEGKFDPQKIRSDFLNKALYRISLYKSFLQSIMIELDIHIDFDNFFKKHVYNFDEGRPVVHGLLKSGNITGMFD